MATGATASDDTDDDDLSSLPFFSDDQASDDDQGSPATVLSLPRSSWVTRRLENRTAPPAGYMVSTGGARAKVLSDAPDWSVVRGFREQAAAKLEEALQAQTGLTVAGSEELGRGIITDLLNADVSEHLRSGQTTRTTAEQQQLAEAVFNALFKLGRLQPLIDEADIENIEIRGQGDRPARVLVETSDGAIQERPSVADSDDELIDFVSFTATHSQVNARSFSETQPRLHLRLDGGARLAATAWTTPHPVVFIRRHRLRNVELADLVERDMLTSLCASFLAAAVRAGRTIVVSGAQGAGKTTMVRALCNQIPFAEHIGTFETEYELFLDEMPDRHLRVTAQEARPGPGERGVDGRQAGEITLLDLLNDSFRHRLDRQIVGEIRGDEVLAMMKAMQSSNGSISTTHARNARGAIDKLITCALEAGPHVTPAYAERAIAGAIELVVHVQLDTRTEPDGTVRRLRYISEVLAVEPGQDGRGWSATDVFKLDPFNRVSVPNVLPDPLRDLQNHGFNLAEFNALAPSRDGSGALR